MKARPRRTGRAHPGAAIVFGVALGLATACSPPLAPPDVEGVPRDAEPPFSGNGRFEVVVLGVAQDGGVPHLGCDRPCCASARERGIRRAPASLGVFDTAGRALALLEATPAVESQVARLQRAAGAAGRGRRPVDALLLTHAHVGHYSGLVQFGREVAATDAIPTFVTPRFAAYLRANGPWSQLVRLGQIDLVEIEPDSGVRFAPLPGLEVEALSVPHRDEFADTVAFRMTGSDRTLLFLPDVDAWAPGLLDRVLEGVDVAFLDATFYDGRELPGRDLSEIPHPPMVETMDALEARVASGELEVAFIHLNHTNPALRDPGVIAEVERRGFRVAREGERIRF